MTYPENHRSGVPSAGYGPERGRRAPSAGHKPPQGRHRTPPAGGRAGASSPRRAHAGPASKPLGSGRIRTDAKLARQVAAVASLAAGVVHVAATPAHWGEWPLAGLFFAGTAAFQLLWGLLAIPVGSTFLRVSGLVANLGFLVLWAVSRLYGMPFGPAAGVPESVGRADLIASALEVTVIAGLSWSLLPRERHGVLSPGGYRAAVALAFVVMGTATLPGVTDALTHSHAEGGHGHGHGGEEETAEAPSDPDPETSAEAEGDEPAPAEEDHTHAPGEEHD